MNNEQLFKKVKSHWPASVDISDAESFADDEFRSWNLVECEENATSRVPASEVLVQAAIWPFHIAICEAAKDRHARGFTNVDVDDVDIEIFYLHLKAHLTEPCWEQARQKFLD